MKTPQAKLVRQGDVLLVPVTTKPTGCVEIPNDNGRIVLAYGEVTGHAHAIADHKINEGLAAKLANAVIARASVSSRTKAKLWQAPNGERFLEVTEPVTLRHEEHTAHGLLPGIYHLPVQMEYTPEELRSVVD